MCSIAGSAGQKIQKGGTAAAMRIWAKEWKNNHLLRDITVEDFSDETRTHKVFGALDQVCREFDLQHPIWLDSTVREFQRHARCRFTKDSFTEEIPFDYLELQIIEED